MEIQLLYVPFPDPETADRIGKIVISEGLAACMNLQSIHSLYNWQGTLHEELETVGVFKTHLSHLPDLRARIEALHPYEVPCLASWSGQVNEAYGLWVAGCLKPISSG